MMRRFSLLLCSLLLPLAAAAQQRPIFDPDDFLDPNRNTGPVFISRLVTGVAWNYVDDYRPLHDNAGYLHLANNFYYKQVQIDYKYSEIRAEDPVAVKSCGCGETVYFPTPPPDDATPAPPPPSRKDMLQAGWYVSLDRGPNAPPMTLRYRVSWAYQRIGTSIEAPDQTKSRLSGREQSFGFDGDLWIPVRGHSVFGSLYLARNVRTGTYEDRRQTEFAYTSRFPAIVLPKRILLRTTLTVGGVTNRGGTGINVINPLFEWFWRDPKTRANVHLIYSPQSLRDGNGWSTHHQIALLVDRALYVKVFHSR
jgi:hypothetical protein